MVVSELDQLTRDVNDALDLALVAANGQANVNGVAMLVRAAVAGRTGPVVDRIEAAIREAVACEANAVGTVQLIRASLT